jgi:hypothetical protein
MTTEIEKLDSKNKQLTNDVKALDQALLEANEKIVDKENLCARHVEVILELRNTVVHQAMQLANGARK